MTSKLSRLSSAELGKLKERHLKAIREIHIEEWIRERYGSRIEPELASPPECGPASRQQ